MAARREVGGFQLFVKWQEPLSIEPSSIQLPRLGLDQGYDFPGHSRIPSMTLDFSLSHEWPAPVPMTKCENIRVAWDYLKGDLKEVWTDLRFLLRAIVERA